MPAGLTRAIPVLLLWLPLSALAQDMTAGRVGTAMRLLDETRAVIDRPQDAGSVAQLAQGISRYEAGLLALEAGIRDLVAHRQEIVEDLAAREARTAALLAALRHFGTMDAPLPLLHPGGAAGAVRAGILLSQASQALAGQAEDLRAEVAALEAVDALRRTAEARLREATGELEAADAALDEALAARAPLPRRFLPDPVREAILLSTAETVDEFVAQLDALTPDALPLTSGGASEAPAPPFPLPVRGTVLGAAADRPGIFVDTRPGALVTSPADATLRYAGPLPELGEAVILEPRAGVLLILAGLDRRFAGSGDIVEAGDPLGRTGGPREPARDKIDSGLSTDGDETGARRTDTLYIEVRDTNGPVEPAAWFRMQVDG